MREIREVNENEIEDLITISANAYPGIDLFEPANRDRFRERLKLLDHDLTTHSYALFEDGQMRGVMRWHDFTMNFFGTQTLVGGLGGVAVDLPHKKEKVAADMVRAFHQHYVEMGACLAALYPFRPDFYRRMGYGYGTPRYSYRFKPASLPRGNSKANVVFLGVDDYELLETCYTRYLERTHGLMARPATFWKHLLENPKVLVAGVEREGSLGGYAIFQFEKGAGGNFLSNDLYLRELVYETADDLSRLSTFLHSQADQVENIIYNALDESFFYLLHDPRKEPGAALPQIIYHETGAQGVGIMYRVINVPRLFEVLASHNFGGETCRLALNLSDSFLPQNSGTAILDVVSGKARLTPQAIPEVTLSLDVAQFSSLVTGSIDLRTLTTYGLANLSDDAYLDKLDHLFRGPKPLCLTSF